MIESKKERPREPLPQHPDLTNETTDEKINLYQQRSEEKKVLIEERGFSNIMAESFLDKLGYPRPPGWHSVFFYPDSNRPRNAIAIRIVVALGVALIVIVKLDT